MNNIIKTSRRTFFNISSFEALAMFRRGLFYYYLSIYLRFFLGLSVTETTFFATFPMILNILFQTFIWGAVSDKYQKRRTLIILGEIFAAISTFFVWYLHTLPHSNHIAGYIIIIGLSCVEMFWSMSNVGWSTLLSDLYPEHLRAGVQGKLSSIGAVGRFLGIWVGGFSYNGFSKFYEGWGFDKGLLFFIASGIMIISTIPMFFVPEGGIDVSRQNSNMKDVKVARIQSARKFSISKQFLIFLFAMVFINFGRNSTELIKSQYLVLDDGFNVSSNLLSHILNMASASIFFTGLFIRKLTLKLKDEILLILGIIIALLYLLGFMLATSLPIIFISNFIAGSSWVVIFASSYSYASRLIPPEKRGRQFALFNATLFLSWGIPSTIIAGPIVDQLIKKGSTQVFAYKMSFLAAVILMLIGTFIFLFATKMDKSTKARRKLKK